MLLFLLRLSVLRLIPDFLFLGFRVGFGVVSGDTSDVVALSDGDVVAVGVSLFTSSFVLVVVVDSDNVMDVSLSLLVP